MGYLMRSDQFRCWTVRLAGGLLAVVLLGLAAARVQQAVLLGVVDGDDFTPYWNGARSVSLGESPYAWTREPRSQELTDYIYPPLLALLLAPAAAQLDYATARWGWLVVNVACLAAAAGLVWRATGLTAQGRPGLALVAALGLVPSTMAALATGQLSLVLLLMLSLGYAALRAGHAGWAGAWVAIAASLKSFPGLVAAYFLLRGQWRALGGGLLGGGLVGVASALVLGPSVYATYLAEVVPRQSRWFAGPFNVSLTGLWQRLLAEQAFTVPVMAANELARALTLVSCAAVVAVTAHAVWRTRAQPVGAAFGSLVVAALLVSPITGWYAVPIALLPLAIASARVQATWPHGLRPLLIASVLLGMPTDFCDLASVQAYCLSLGPERWGELPWRHGWGTLLSTGPLAGLLLLWGLLLAQCYAAPAAAPAAVPRRSSPPRARPVSDPHLS